ncbi:MAG TPA: catalase family peroxidase [Burkholderiales bacterium]|nr:catalase family peroxidase [Burkholderiales bacterium]
MLNRNDWKRWLAAGLLVLGSHAAQAVDNEVTAEKVVNAIEGTFGVTPGERRNHTKGTCAVGEFIGTKEAAKYSRSLLFTGKPIPVIARFSLAGGNPKAPDTAKSPRGMALEFKLPDGSLQHITMINTPIFGAANPKTFLDLMVAMKPDPATGKPDPEKIKAFKASHPDNLAQANFLADNNPPISYANSAYFGLHTFKFINQQNKTTFVRWRFVPEDGEKRLSDSEMKSSPPNFLETSLIGRTKKGPVKWDMIVSIGKPGDTQDNPTVAWPADRQQINAGTLSIAQAMPQKGAACEKINYDPLVMSNGIEPTNDPVLLFRSPAYAISFGRRLSGQ